MIRKATLKDKHEVIAIYEAAIDLISKQGSAQWQGESRPSRKSFFADLDQDSIYVKEENGEIVAVVSLTTNEPEYDYIEGAWLSDKPYVIMRRVAKRSDRRGQPDIEDFLDYIHEELNYESIRISTHELNKPMQNFLLRNGFIYCGMIYLNEEYDNKRCAFQKDFD